VILVLAGTSESREIVADLQNNGWELLVSVVTEYGVELIAEPGLEVLQGSLDRKSLLELIAARQIDIIIDATHPFAAEISRLAIQAAAETEAVYLRFERENIDFSRFAGREGIYPVKGYQEAACQSAKLADIWERILLTIGSQRLEYFIEEIENWQKRLVVRFLPVRRFFRDLERQGFSPRNLIGMQGPCSREMNRAILMDYEISVLVTKASGSSGGLPAKIEAAREINIPVVLIERPEIDYPRVFHDCQKLMEEVSKIQED